MHSFFAFLVVCLLSSITLAAPSSSLSSRLQRRRGFGRASDPMVPAPPSVVKALNNGRNATDIIYSTNWAGAAWSHPPGTFKSITAEFTVPTPKLPLGATNTFASASAWVGIDGETCQSAILQTGVDFTISDGKVTYDAWYEWWPAFAEDYTNFAVDAGDIITVTATAVSTNIGQVTIENKTTGQKLSQDLTSPHALCLENAEWIVEDYDLGGVQVPFADIGTLKFKDAVATTNSGETIGPGGAQIIDLALDGKRVSRVSATSTEVSVKYLK